MEEPKTARAEAPPPRTIPPMSSRSPYAACRGTAVSGDAVGDAEPLFDDHHSRNRAPERDEGGDDRCDQVAARAQCRLLDRVGEDLCGSRRQRPLDAMNQLDRERVWHRKQRRHTQEGEDRGKDGEEPSKSEGARCHRHSVDSHVSHRRGQHFAPARTTHFVFQLVHASARTRRE